MNFPLQVVFIGAVLGLGYAVVASGIVLVYRSSGIVNFAHVAMGAFGISTFALLVRNYDVPYWVALPLGVAAGAAVGAITELIVVRRLFESSRVVLLIATVGVAQLLQFVMTQTLPDIEFGPIPIAFDSPWAAFEVGPLRVGVRETSALLLVTPALIGLGLLLTRTRTGLRLRGVADSLENSRLIGVSPKRVSTLVWVIAAGFAAFTQIAMAPLTTRTAQELAAVSTVGLLLRALVIALAAQMRSIPLVVAAGVTLGIVESLVALNLNDHPGIFDLFLFVAALLLVVLPKRVSAGSNTPFNVGVRSRTVVTRPGDAWWLRHISKGGMLTMLVLALMVPIFVTKSSELLVWTRLLIFAAIALSLTLLTGWAGQLSLGQMAFVGVGGLSAMALHEGNTVGIGLPIVGELFAFTAHLPWFVAVLAGTVVGVFFALLIGLPSLRVRGLFLAVTTLAFAAMTASWMFGLKGWSGGGTSVSSLAKSRPVVGSVSFQPPRMYYLLCVLFLVVVTTVVGRLRRTGIGRFIIAVRDNESMTAAATVSPTRAKLTAFAVSGGIAAMAGAMYVYLLPGFSPAGTESPFSPTVSLQIVAMVIIGGLGSIPGAILGAAWVIGLPAAFGITDTVQLLTTNIGLLVLLLYFPGGLIEIVYAGRDAVLRFAHSRRDSAEGSPAVATVRLPTRSRARELPPAPTPLLATNGVSVSFGGVRAVSDVTLHVDRDEIVGLIGTNGAGKSTLMNAISGFVPATGRIDLLGVEISDMPAFQRHALGLGRGFQDAALFNGLSCRETILVALEARERSLLVPSLLALPPSPKSERRKSAEATDIIDFLGLGHLADISVADLSTGMRRIVELACLIATDAKVLLLDEPTAGMAQRETEAFAPLIREVQRELSASIVVIEHDMPLIMAISDRVYCLEAGLVIASGSPTEVRNDSRVIASYLGTDDVAITRSNQLQTSSATSGSPASGSQESSSSTVVA